ncbi:sigma-70 family RNA polymerase sigma factor [Mycobacterium xenopi]|uniref:sigma-70 family RNA polymerase sigma factor n=1 Tax=Mycobacterium xenopi TaxID=1789 RepID=UPI00146D1E37|nr:sigma-70 family RNA polymerase sigma factor [Mycobacterium xenopi]
MPIHDNDRWLADITTPELADAPIAQLVDGLVEQIGPQAIPYGQLPQRARTFYSADFTTWSDLADQTISSLLNRPQAGAATVRAILAAARDAVARARSIPPSGGDDAASAVARLLERLTERDRIILSARLWAFRPRTNEEIGQALGVSDATIWRNQAKAKARFAELLADPAHRDVIAHAEELRRRVGPLARHHTVGAVLADLGLDLSSPEGLMLLYIAGPYGQRDNWLENTSTGALSTAAAALDAAVARWGAPTTEALVDELGLIGMRRDSAVDFIESRGLRRFGEKWVRWGASVADRAEAVLHVSGAPASADMIAAAIGQNCHPRQVREALYGDDRFARATRYTWALRAWGLDEYLGIFGELTRRIDAGGGTISVADLVSYMKARVPDVAEISIRTYLTNAPGFVIEDGMVRRRTAADGLPEVPPLHTVRGVFRNGRNEIRLSLPVTHDLLRGSGQHTHPAVAAAFGITPGQQRPFTSRHGHHITVTWPLSTTHGPSLGSLRPLALAVGAAEGDALVLVFNLRDNAIDAALIKGGEDPHRHLQTLLGKPAREPIAALARALRCKPNQVASILRERGDIHILELLTPQA